MLHHNNCFEVFSQLPDESIDLILTDPPYGIDYQLHITTSKERILTKIQNDKDTSSLDWDLFFSEAHRVLKPKKSLYMFGRFDFLLRISQHIQSGPLKYNHDFILSKGDMASGNLNIFGTTHELVVGLSKGTAEKSRLVTIDGEQKKRTKAHYVGKVSTKEYVGHPTQKPVGLLSYIIQNRTDPGDTVFDPFNGSGSTTLAAKLLHRQWIGAEIDAQYHHMATQRLSNPAIEEYYRARFKRGFVSRGGGISLEK